MQDLSQSLSVKKKIFFPNLDGVRAIAASLVVIWHIEMVKPVFNFNHFLLPDLGYIGVTIFLVLSGFLITYLLLEERASSPQQTINYKNFYIRRILRIWPLYFLVFFFGYFIYPANMTPITFVFCVFFLSNFAEVFNMLPDFIDPIWSIGVEEQFYLFQPHLLRVKKLQHIFMILIFILAGIYGLKFGLKLLPETTIITYAKSCLYLFRYDDLVLGSIAAVLLYNDKHKLFRTFFSVKPLFRKSTQVICLLFIVAYLLLKLRYKELMNNELFSVAIAILILNLCQPETCLFSLQNKIFSFLGRISYGLYLIHKFPLFLLLYFAREYFPNSNIWLLNLYIYFLTFALSVGLAWLSFTYFESYFLNLKNRYAKIVKQ